MRVLDFILDFELLVREKNILRLFHLNSLIYNSKSKKIPFITIKNQANQIFKSIVINPLQNKKKPFQKNNKTTTKMKQTCT